MIDSTPEGSWRTGAVDLKGWFSMTRSMESGSGGTISLPYSSFELLNIGKKKAQDIHGDVEL
jgi:hypothetical protein